MEFPTNDSDDEDAIKLAKVKRVEKADKLL